MDISDKHPCEDERCAMFLTESDDPFICIHHDPNAEAIDYWGRVARGELSVNDVIEEYRDFLDFDTATSIPDHFDANNSEWEGPTVEIEVRKDNEPVKSFTAYPHDKGLFPGFESARLYAEGFAEGLLEAAEIWDTDESPKTDTSD